MDSQHAIDWKSFVNKNSNVRRIYLDLKRVDRNITALRRTKLRLQIKSEKHTKLLYCCLSNSISRKIAAKKLEKQELLHAFEDLHKRFIDTRFTNELQK